MSSKNIKAREVPQLQASERKVADVSTRPLKLAFVINETLPLTELLKIIEFNSIIWGGYYNLLIPTTGKELTTSWWQALIAFNPDKVIVCGKISDALVREIHARVGPFAFGSGVKSFSANNTSKEMLLTAFLWFTNYFSFKKPKVQNSKVRSSQILPKFPLLHASGSKIRPAARVISLDLLQGVTS